MSLRATERVLSVPGGGGGVVRAVIARAVDNAFFCPSRRRRRIPFLPIVSVLFPFAPLLPSVSFLLFLTPPSFPPVLPSPRSFPAVLLSRSSLAL